MADKITVTRLTQVKTELVFAIKASDVMEVLREYAWGVLIKKADLTEFPKNGGLRICNDAMQELGADDFQDVRFLLTSITETTDGQD